MVPLNVLNIKENDGEIKVQWSFIRDEQTPDAHFPLCREATAAPLDFLLHQVISCYDNFLVKINWKMKPEVFNVTFVSKSFSSTLWLFYRPAPSFLFFYSARIWRNATAVSLKMHLTFMSCCSSTFIFVLHQSASLVLLKLKCKASPWA